MSPTLHSIKQPLKQFYRQALTVEKLISSSIFPDGEKQLAKGEFSLQLQSFGGDSLVSTKINWLIIIFED